MKKKFRIYIYIFIINTFSFAQNEIPNIYLSEADKISDPTSFSNANSALLKMVENKNYDAALIYANKLLEVSKRLKLYSGTGTIYHRIGRIKNETGQKIQAVINYEQAGIHFNKANNIRGLAAVKNDIGVIERELGNLEKSADYLLESTMNFSRLKDTLGISSGYNNLGNVYAGLGDFQSAKKYYNKSLFLKKAKKMDGIEIMLNNIALLYIDHKRSDSAKVLLNQALRIGKEKKNMRSLGQSYSVLGKVFFTKKEYQTAKKYYDSTIAIGDKADWKILILNAQQQVGLVSVYLKDYKKADQLLTKTREKFEALKAVPLLLKNYRHSTKLDSARGNFASALAWQKKYQKVSNERAALASKNKINSTKARYEAELEHLKLIDEQERKEQENIASLFKYRILTYIVLGILLITSVFLFIILRNRKRIQAYVEQLNESNQVKNKLFSIISHDLKNEISGLDGSLSLIKENAFSPEEFQEIIPLLSNRTHQTSILLNNLLNWSKSQMKELNANPTLFDISDVIASKFSYFKPKAEQKNIKLINKLARTVIYADKDMFGIITQNLIANAVKFCDSGDSVTLLSEELNNHYKIYFIDTGIGIDPKNLEKLFAEDTFTTNGTQNETGTGLGLKICKELTELNNGEIMVDSTLGHGSTFSVTFPKSN